MQLPIDDTFKPTRNPFTSFAFSPAGISFEHQDNDEKVILLLRRHWVTNSGWFLTSLFMGLLPFLLSNLFIWYGMNLWADLGLKWQTEVVMIWYLLLVGFVFERFLSWYFNVYIVTNERIIDVDFRGIFYKKVSEAQLIRIQDVTHRSGGFMPLLFNYGDIIVQTAAEMTNLSIERVPNPAGVHRIIGDLVEEANNR